MEVIVQSVTNYYFSFNQFSNLLLHYLKAFTY